MFKRCPALGSRYSSPVLIVPAYWWTVIPFEVGSVVAFEGHSWPIGVLR